MPGVAVATTSSRPVVAIRPTSRLNPWVSSHSMRAASGVIDFRVIEP